MSDELIIELMLILFVYLFLVPGRVRVAVRLRPRNAEEMVADADFADCVELQPEVILEQNCLNVPVIFL